MENKYCPKCMTVKELILIHGNIDEDEEHYQCSACKEVFTGKQLHQAKLSLESVINMCPRCYPTRKLPLIAHVKKGYVHCGECGTFVFKRYRRPIFTIIAGEDILIPKGQHVTIFHSGKVWGLDDQKYAITNHYFDIAMSVIRKLESFVEKISEDLFGEEWPGGNGKNKT